MVSFQSPPERQSELELFKPCVHDREELSTDRDNRRGEREVKSKSWQMYKTRGLAR